ncbi:unnamed protein product, partial [Pylaiella littoralis]
MVVGVCGFEGALGGGGRRTNGNHSAPRERLSRKNEDSRRAQQCQCGCAHGLIDGNARHPLSQCVVQHEGRVRRARSPRRTADQARRSRERGVVVPDVDNPLKELVFDRVRGIGVDILHQDSLNKAKRMIRFLLNALNTDGSALVSGRLKLRSIIPPNAEPLGDVTTDGGFSALTGN